MVPWGPHPASGEGAEGQCPEPDPAMPCPALGEGACMEAELQRQMPTRPGGPRTPTEAGGGAAPTG